MSLFLHGFSIAASLIGGVSLFLSLTITHFWYGISRYPSIWNNYVSDDLVGSRLDENFAEIRDICSYYYNGHNRSDSQMEAFLITLPFTIIYHINGFILMLISRVFGDADEEAHRRFPSPIAVSVLVSNIMMVMLWFLGGNVGMALSTATTIFNQNFYNSLFFRRSFRDFVLSFIFGNLLVIQDKEASSVRATKKLRASVIGASGIALVAKSRGQGLEKETSSQRTLTKSNKFKDKGPQTTSHLPDDFSHDAGGVSSTDVFEDFTTPKGAIDEASSPSLTENKEGDGSNRGSSNSRSIPSGENSILASEEDAVDNDVKIEDVNDFKIEAANDLRNEASNDFKIEDVHGDSKLTTLTSYRSTEDSFSHRLQHIVTVLSPEFEKSDTEFAELSGREARMAQSVTGAPIISKQTERGVFPKNNDDDDDALSSNFLNPSDVHIDIENHPGTIAWRNCISDALEKFPIKTYTFRKHNWVMKKMHGRQFFVKENGKSRRKLNRSEIKKRSRIVHEKQLDLRKQIAGILTDLKDLKKNHNSSKSNSDHSRNSKKSAVPMEGAEQPLTILSKDSSVDEEKRKRDKQKPDAASAAKDSQVESSKESTISTLTQSNPPKSVEARSTPWIQGPAEEVKELNTTGAVENNSDHMKRVINGILDYTSWLENLNPLRESGGAPLGTEGKDRAEEGQRNIGEVRDQNPSGKPIDDVATGGIELVKETPYWRSLVEDFPMKRKKPLTAPSPQDNEGVDNIQPPKSPPKTIHWDVENRQFIDTADVKTRERRKIFPLWRLALHKKKGTDTKKDNKKSNIKPVDKAVEIGPIRESNRNGVSFWRKKKTFDVSVIVDDEGKMDASSPESGVKHQLRRDKSTQRIHVTESRNDERDELERRRGGETPTGRHPSQKRITNHKLDNGMSDNIHREAAPAGLTRSQPMPSYDQILAIMDEKYLADWEGEGTFSEKSFSDSGHSTIHQTDASENSLRQSKTDKSRGGLLDNRCTPQNCGMECDALDGITRACALQAGPDEGGQHPLYDEGEQSLQSKNFQNPNRRASVFSE
jgi:hypothetical protein